MAQKLWTGIASLLGIAPTASAESEDADAVGRERRPPRARSRPAPKTLSAALESYQDAIAAGRVHLLDLGAIKSDLGDQWAQAQDRVTTAMDSILRHRLTAADFHSRIDDASYVLVLHSRTDAEARMLCGLIAMEVKHKLFGEERDVRDIQIATAKPLPDGTVELVDLDPTEAVAEALKTGRLKLNEEPAKAAPKPVDEPQPTWQPIEHPRHEKPPVSMVPLNDAIRSLESALHSVKQQIEPQQGAPLTKAQRLYDPNKVTEDQNELARRAAAVKAIEESRRAADAAAAQPPPSRAATFDLVDSVSFTYRPIWDCTRHAVTWFNLEVMFQVGSETKSLSEIEASLGRPEIIAAIDQLVVKKGLADLTRMIAQGSKAIVSLPVHRSVLDHPAKREPILALLRALPSEMQRLIALEIVDSYAGDWALLPALLATFRRVCRDVVMRVSLDLTDMRRIKASGLRMVGGDLREHPWSETQALRELEAFAKAADEAGIDSYVDGLGAMSTVVAAVCAGFDLVSGSAVAKDVEFPSGVYFLDSVNLYLRRRAAPTGTD